jgi:hypothetical protein
VIHPVVGWENTLSQHFCRVWNYEIFNRLRFYHLEIFMDLTAPKMEAMKLFAIAAFFGFVAHRCFFKQVEVDTHPLLVATTFLGAPFAVKHVLSSYFQQYSETTLGTSFLIVGCFLLSLWTSVLLYRTFFHPLNNFPGPFPAKLSKVWALTQVAKTGLKWYQVDATLHQKYGDYVRTGMSPNIPINHVDHAYLDCRA